MGPILVVDDNMINREVLVRKLKKKGFELLEAENGDDAVKLAIEEKPSVVLMDLKMPGKDGWEVCRELKGSPVTKDIKIVALTASFLDDEFKAQLDETGFDGYLSKPAQTEKVVEMISGVVGR